MLSEADRQEIATTLSKRLRDGDLALLLGAGFSINNESSFGRLPDGEGLRDLILERCGRAPGLKTTLKDAYGLGKRSIENFPEFLKSIFTVGRVEAWQRNIFAYAWKRIYTTNIDNVLNVAHEWQKRSGRLGGDYGFFNYVDPSLVSESIGTIPVVTIHGTSSKPDEGFIFSNFEYAVVSAKLLDWHRDLASRALTGGLVVVGNQLDESDLDAYIAERRLSYGVEEGGARNWIVMPNPDAIRKENYEAAGYRVFDSTAQDFFECLFAATAPRTIGEIALDRIPSVREAARNVQAMTWFRASMTPVVSEIEAAASQSGILRHFITGDDPEWRYIVQGAHAITDRETALTKRIGSLLGQQSNGIGVLHVVGPSGSGKTTTIRAALRSIVGTYPYVYEFKEDGTINPEFLREIISRFTSKSVFVFYSASEFYYAISYIADHFRGKVVPFVLFVLEDRSNDYARNRRQLKRPDLVEVFEVPDLTVEDATSIARKIEEFGLVYEGFSNLPLDRRARRIVDKERGFSGDLLSTLFSLTTGEHFEGKIHQDYFSVRDPRAKEALEAVAILGALGFNVPLNYVSGFLDIPEGVLQKLLVEDLAGVLFFVPRQGIVRCRHRVIANFYFRECVSRHGSSRLILQMLHFLSRQFTVADIRNHPLPYRIYKEIVAFEFLVDSYFAPETALESTEGVYQECQKLFGTDGIFWMHFGRFYRKTGRLDHAIDCFRTGLQFFVSNHTRHQLGVALLERYLENGRTDHEDYREGIETLDTERLSRGLQDPYPVGTMLDWLRRIVDLDPENSDAADRLKVCANYGLRHFRDDPYVREQLKRYLGHDV